MKRKIVNINEEKCNGCGLCIEACHEGALKLIDGKAKLTSESYCDGLGDCLPECPTGAIKIEEREAEPFDEEAVKKHIENKGDSSSVEIPTGCPGTMARKIKSENNKSEQSTQNTVKNNENSEMKSELQQWPCQIKLVPVNAPYFDQANLLIAADCTAFSYANIHNEFMKNNITLIGCPKLDDVDYSEKLTEILKRNEIKNLTVMRMEVPCCGGIVNAVKKALKNSGKMIPWQVITISTDGNVIDN